MDRLTQQHLLHAQHRMKNQADKHRSERSFEVGDWVFIKLQPYVQSSLAPRANQKLAFKFFGPYQIAAKVGSCCLQVVLASVCAYSSGVLCIPSQESSTIYSVCCFCLTWCFRGGSLLVALILFPGPLLGVKQALMREGMLRHRLRLLRRLLMK
jgi:hypothetical protein